jgi:hypothetical protein
LAACYLLDSRRDFNGGGDVLMMDKDINVPRKEIEIVFYKEFLSRIPDKDLYEEVNRRHWEQLDKARLEYEAKGKRVMD